MTTSNNTIKNTSSNSYNINTSETIITIPDLYKRVRQSLLWAKDDLYNYQDEFQTGLDMLHELIQNDEFVDDDARELIIETLEGYLSQIEEKSRFKNKLVSKLLYEIKHQND
jgi:hypothetical protein